MLASDKCIELIKKWEGCKLESYKCVAGVWTIGYGSIRWKDGERVKQGQVISQKEAEELLKLEVNKKALDIKSLDLNMNQNQFDSIVSFVYNVGITSFKRSTLFKIIKIDSHNPQIKDEFLRWNKARIKGKLSKVVGLTNRRIDETELYFSEENNI